jgi:hypothetical protein
VKVEANDALPFLYAFIMKRDPKLATEVYRKPTYTSRYLHFKSNRPHHVKREVIHSSIRRAKVICQDQKDFNKEIRNIRHDVMLNENPQEFLGPIMNPSRSNHPFSDITY